MTRTSCTITDNDLHNALKHTLTRNPYKRIDDWIGLSDEGFVKEFQASFEAIAAHTYRLNEVALMAVMQKLWKADKHEKEAFCGKFSKAFQAAWCKSKKLKSGERTSSVFMSLYEVWGQKYLKDKAEVRTKTQSSSGRVKVEQARSLKSEASSPRVKHEDTDSPRVSKKVKTEETSPVVKRLLVKTASSPLVPAWSSPKIEWGDDTRVKVEPSQTRPSKQDRSATICISIICA